LRSKDTDLEKTYGNTTRETPQDICNKYKYYFSHLSGKEINDKFLLKISSFKAFLLKAITNLEKLKKQAKALADSKGQYNA